MCVCVFAIPCIGEIIFLVYDKIDYIADIADGNTGGGVSLGAIPFIPV